MDATGIGMVFDGVTDNTEAFLRIASLSGSGCKIKLPAGTAIITNGVALSNLKNIVFEGEGEEITIIKLLSGNLSLKAPDNVIFKNLSFHGTANDIAGTPGYQSVWVSNYNKIKFKSCTFRHFGGLTKNKVGSVALFLYAGDSVSSNLASGDSKNARVLDCTFDGDSRFTNFGIRLFTEFNTSEMASNSDGLITGCTFNGFNWNAVEIAGPKTSSIRVSNCVANLCGLTPFDLDKGVTSCAVTNVTINRLLGNIDTDVNPNTAITCVAIQGTSNAGGYSTGCTVNDVTVNLLAADLNAYTGRGCAAVGAAYCKNSTISNIVVNIDTQPIKPITSTYAFAVVRAYTISGVKIKNILTTNATVGITGQAENGLVGSEYNIFEDIVNIGVMKGEALNYSSAAGVTSKNIYKSIKFKTDGSDLIYPYNNSILSLTSDLISASAFLFENCHFASDLQGINGVNGNASVASFDDVNMSIPNSANWFKPISKISNLYFGDNSYNGLPVDRSLTFANLSSTSIVHQRKTAQI